MCTYIWLVCSDADGAGFHWDNWIEYWNGKQEEREDEKGKETATDQERHWRTDQLPVRILYTQPCAVTLSLMLYQLAFVISIISLINTVLCCITLHVVVLLKPAVGTK